MNFWWGRRSKGGHKGNLWNVNIFFFLAMLWTAPLIAFARIKLSEFSFSSLAPFSPAKQENRNEHLPLHNFSVMRRFFSCCPPLKIKMISKQDIFLEYDLNEPPLFFILVVYGGGTPGTGSVWLYFSAEEEMRGLLLLSVYACTVLIVVIFLPPIIHTNECTPLPSFCRWNIHRCDFNHSFHHRGCFGLGFFG